MWVYESAAGLRKLSLKLRILALCPECRQDSFSWRTICPKCTLEAFWKQMNENLPWIQP
jgi:predicted amidophosphoribosyltransferase